MKPAQFPSTPPSMSAGLLRAGIAAAAAAVSSCVLIAMSAPTDAQTSASTSAAPAAATPTQPTEPTPAPAPASAPAAAPTAAPPLAPTTPSPASASVTAQPAAVPAPTGFGSDWKPFFADPAPRAALPATPIALGRHYTIRLPKGMVRKPVTDKMDPGEEEYQFDSGMQSNGIDNILAVNTIKLPSDFPATKETLTYMLQVMQNHELPALVEGLQNKHVTPTERGLINGMPFWRVRVTGSQTDHATQLKATSYMFAYIGYDAANKQMVDLTGGIVKIDNTPPASTPQTPLEAATLTFAR